MSFPTNLALHLDEHAGPDAPDLARLLGDLALALKQISRDLGRAGLADLHGDAGSTSHQGEDQKKIDVLADRLITAALVHSGQVCALASEEHEAPIPMPVQSARGKYAVLFDPLDGSGNIDAGIATGTIFAVYRRTSPRGTPGTLADLMRPGREQVCAGYCLYSSATQLVLAFPGRVDGFTLDTRVGEFLRSHPSIMMPARGKVYSANEGNAHTWDPVTREFVASRRRGKSSRYVGALVADFHRILLQGGVFLYPSDCSREGEAKPKLRLLYEGNPLGFVARAAGGRATTGRHAILDLEPTSLHQRVPLVLGSDLDVDDYERAMGGIA